MNNLKNYASLTVFSTSPTPASLQDVEDPAYRKPSDCKNISLFQKLSLTKALL